ncbi:hypothetical protein FHQ08_11870 [Lactobacillus sp. CC-MHH1034]|uniref:hypothetical protein n=1 Tax=Agrilactobacillus fermenti TaxID=2586909 RepID=UPI001E5DCF95|nr:hypothetical protein [Agrilactobacillus fermenti]MCD2257383.1 hypothetical protein [Agrilactobacillus fermenti]
MDPRDYVTHAELDHKLDNIENKIDRLSDHLDSKIDGLSDKTDLKLQNVQDKLSSQNKLLWWIMGIISAGIVVPLLAFIFHAIVK